MKVHIAPHRGGGVIFDFGANVGIFSAIAASMGGKVYAFEPVPACWRILEEVVQIYPHIEICKIAVSDASGSIKMTDTDNLEINRVVSGEYDGETIEVKCRTVDDFTEENDIRKLDFMKADIEGIERKMLLGAKRTLKKLQPDLSLCTYHYDDDPVILPKIILEANDSYKVIHEYKKLFASVKN